MITNKDQKALQNKIFLILVIFSGVMVLLAGRLLWLQVFDNSQLDTKNLSQVKEERKLQSPRGTIFDRNGNPLAISIVTRSLYADPKMIKQSPEEIAKLIAPYTRIKEETIVKRLQEDTAFIWLDRMMDPDKSKAVDQVIKDNELVGLNFVNESRRFYPNGNLLAQVLGFVGTDDKGLDGLEMQMDDTLRGGTTKELIATDSHGTAILALYYRSFCRKKKKVLP